MSDSINNSPRDPIEINLMLAATLLIVLSLSAVEGARLSHLDSRDEISESIKTEQAAFMAEGPSSAPPTGAIKLN